MFFYIFPSIYSLGQELIRISGTGEYLQIDKNTGLSFGNIKVASKFVRDFATDSTILATTIKLPNENLCLTASDKYSYVTFVECAKNNELQQFEVVLNANGSHSISVFDTNFCLSTSIEEKTHKLVKCGLEANKSGSSFVFEPFSLTPDQIVGEDSNYSGANGIEIIGRGLKNSGKPKKVSYSIVPVITDKDRREMFMSDKFYEHKVLGESIYLDYTKFL